MLLPPGHPPSRFVDVVYGARVSTEGGGGAVLIRRSGEEKWRAPKVTSYTDEAALQALVAESPDLLGSSESLAVITEMTVPGVGSVDLVAVGASGRMTLVECKLRANPEMRRHVIGHVFAYTAGIWSVSHGEFDRLFTARAGRSLTAAVAKALGGRSVGRPLSGPDRRPQ